jgi:hypothetical protein
VLRSLTSRWTCALSCSFFACMSVVISTYLAISCIVSFWRSRVRARTDASASAKWPFSSARGQVCRLHTGRSGGSGSRAEERRHFDCLEDERVGRCRTRLSCFADFARCCRGSLAASSVERRQISNLVIILKSGGCNLECTTTSYSSNV